MARAPDGAAGDLVAGGAGASAAVPRGRLLVGVAGAARAVADAGRASRAGQRAVGDGQRGRGVVPLAAQPRPWPLRGLGTAAARVGACCVSASVADAARGTASAAVAAVRAVVLRVRLRRRSACLGRRAVSVAAGLAGVLRWPRAAPCLAPWCGRRRRRGAARARPRGACRAGRRRARAARRAAGARRSGRAASGVSRERRRPHRRTLAGPRVRVRLACRLARWSPRSVARLHGRSAVVRRASPRRGRVALAALGRRRRRPGWAGRRRPRRTARGAAPAARRPPRPSPRSCRATRRRDRREAASRRGATRAGGACGVGRRLERVWSTAAADVHRGERAAARSPRRGDRVDRGTHVLGRPARLVVRRAAAVDGLLRTASASACLRTSTVPSRTRRTALASCWPLARLVGASGRRRVERQRAASAPSVGLGRGALDAA